MVELTGFAATEDVLGSSSSLPARAVLCVGVEVSLSSWEAELCAAELLALDGVDEFGVFAAGALDGEAPLADADEPCDAWLLAAGELTVCKSDEKLWLGEPLGAVGPLVAGEGPGLMSAIERFI